jgi:hypothetical protein
LRVGGCICACVCTHTRPHARGRSPGLGLRESRAESASELDKARAALETLRGNYDAVLESARKQQAHADAQAGALRTELRLKTLEWERATIALDDAQVELRKRRAELDTEQKKLALLRNQHAELQTQVRHARQARRLV